MNQPRLSEFDVGGPSVLAEVRAAMLELESKIRSGLTISCESIFAKFPHVLQDKEAVLEVIYTEFVLRQELGQKVSTKEWIDRFPQWSRDLEELFQVHDLVSQDAPLGELSESQTGLESWIEGTDTQFSRPRIGNYEIIKEIGRGSMGTVFLARHRTLGREVAIKTINERDADTPQVLERFRIEAEASAKLQHPNIVQIYEVGLHDRVPFFAMEYVASGNLAQAIHFRPINARDAASLTESLARAIHFAHLQGIVHRDLKPANILLTPSDRPNAVKLEFPNDVVQATRRALGFDPKITDFGLAKRLDLESQQTLPGHAIGTPSYMSPEQTGESAHAAGPASDIYSLGAVLYDMLTGRPPFLAPTVAETLNKVMYEEPISLRSLQANIPRDLETICLKCLRKDPIRRYQSANDLADDVQRYLLGKPILARPAGALERSVKFMRRHPLLTVFLVMLTFGVLAFASQWWRAEMHRTTAERETLKAVAAREDEFAERQRLERVLYAHDISLAKLEYLSNRTTRSKDLLSKWSSNQTQWEHRYLRRTCQHELCDFDDLKFPCRSVAMSPDGKLVAAATASWGIDRECEIKIWRIDSKELLWTLKGHSSSIMDVDFSPDGRYLASIGTCWKVNKPHGGLNVWDVQSGTAIWSDKEISGHCVAFSPDGRAGAVGSDQGDVVFFDAASGASLGRCTGHKGSVHDLAFRPDGKFIVSASRDGTARLWNIEARQETCKIDGMSDARRICYSPDGLECVVGLYSGMAINYRQLNDTLIESNRFAESTPIGAFRYAPDGKTIAVSSQNRSVKLLDIKSLRVMRELHGHNGSTLDVAFDREGIRMATTGEDGHVRVWDLSNLENPDEARRHEVGGPHFSAAAFLPGNNDQVVVALSENTNRGRTPKDFSAKLYDLNKQSFVKGFVGHSDWLTCVAVDPFDGWIATGSRDHSVRIFDRQTGELKHRLDGHADRVLAIASLDNGEGIVTVGADLAMRVWNTETGTMKAHWILASHLLSVVAQPDSKLIATAVQNGGIQLWRDDSPIAVANVSVGPGEVVRLAFSPNGSILAASKSNGAIELWNIADILSGKNAGPETILSGHTESVSSIAFSPDGQRLASCSSDRTVRIWDVLSREEVLSLTAETSIHSHILFSPDGSRLLCVNQNTIGEWSANDNLDTPEDREERRVRWHFSEYVTAKRNDHPFAVVQHVSGILASDHVKQKRLEMLESRSRAWIELGNYGKAISDIESIPVNSRKVTPHNMGLYYLLADDTEGYHRICDETAKDLTSPNKINNATWLCSLVPAAIHRYPTVKAAAIETLESDEANYLNTLGAMYVRSGDFEKGIVTLEKGITIRGRPDPLDWIFLELAHRGLGQNEKAKQYSSTLHTWLQEQELKRRLGDPTDSAFSKDVELELKLFLTESDSSAGRH